MLKKIDRKHIDLAKYDTCISQSKFPILYAQSWYLDIVAKKNWSVWVWKDYQAVMPMVYKRYLGFNFVIQPTFCQQLGVFYQNHFTQEIFNQFEKKLHAEKVISYSFNEENTAAFSPVGKLKVNQTLNLSPEYEILKSQFRKDRKNDLKKSAKQSYHISNEWNPEAFLLNAKKHLPHLKTDWQVLLEIADKAWERGQFAPYQLKNKTQNHLAYVLTFRFKNRITILSNIRNKKLDKYGGITYLFAHIFAVNSESNKIVDFEGSSIPSIQRFNASFRAKIHHYTHYQNVGKWFYFLKKLTRAINIR